MTSPLERIGDFLRSQRAPVPIRADEPYVALGVRGFGRGVFHYPAETGARLSKLRYYDTQPGRLIVSNIKGWEGAVAVLGESDRGTVASNRFLQYEPAFPDVSTAYVAHYLLTNAGVEALGSASPGSADRNRTLSIKNFEDIRLPLPELEAQVEIVARLEQVRAVAARAARELHGVDDLLRQQIESTEDVQPLGDLLEEHYELVDLQAGMTYERAGVLNKGQGLFRQEPFRGGDTSYTTCYRLVADTVVLSRLGAFEGGVAVVDPQFDGYVVSKEFPTLRPRCGVDIQYLRALTSWPGLWEQMAAGSPGTPARRGRMSVPLFLNTLIPRHDEQAQRLIGRTAALRSEVLQRVARRRELSAALLPAARNELFNKLG